jgi:hypothetical protein
MAGTDLGMIHIQSRNQNSKVQTVSLEQDLLCKLKWHSRETQLVASGGEERELHVWDLKNDSKVQWKSKNVMIND